MTGTTRVERLGAFAANASFDQLSEPAVEALKLRVLDSLVTALGALDAEPVALVRRQVEDFGGAPHCSLIGGGRSAPDRAALLTARSSGISTSSSTACAAASGAPRACGDASSHTRGN